MSAICKECGAPLEGRVTESGIVTCQFCGSTHDLHHMRAEARRSLISAADFSGPTVGQWHSGPGLRGHPIGGTPSAWSITLVNDGIEHPLLWAPVSLDDFDVSFAVRFGAGDPGDAIWLKARVSPAGAVTMHLWKEGAITLGWLQPADRWQESVVTARPIKPLADGAWWRLRWVAVGSRHKAYLNGSLVLTATHEPIRHSGFLEVRLHVAGASTTVDLAELAVFEPPA